MNLPDHRSAGATFSRRRRAAKIRLLAELGHEILVLSPQGFLLLYQERSLDAIADQLRDFDALEWRAEDEMLLAFAIEFEGMAPIDRRREASDILAACSPEARELLNEDILNLEGSNLEFYNLIHSTDPFRVKARVQALTVLPMLKWEFSSMTLVTDRIRRRIDAGKSVWDAFLEMHPGKASILRRIASGQASPAPWRGNLAGLLALLDPFPPEKVPNTDQEWNAFVSIYLGLALEREQQSNRRLVKLRWMEESGRLGWVKACERFAAIDGGLAAIADAFDFLDEVGDAGNHLAAQSGEKFVSMEDSTHKAYQRWMKAPNSLGMFRIVEYSGRWHRMLWAEAGLSFSSSSNRDWPLLLDEPVELSPRIYAVSLGSHAALIEESKRMQHCVGGYWLSCFLGISHIISMRDRKDQSLSTIEIRIADHGNATVQIIQHKSYRNRTPDTTLRALEGRLTAAVNQRADFAALAKWRKKAMEIYKSQNRDPLGPFSRRFSEERFERLAAVLGRDRLLRLFGAEK